MSKKLSFKDFRNYYKSSHKFGMTAFDDITKGFNNYMNPYIIKEADRDQTQLDIFSELMSKRQIFFGTEVSADSANILVSQLLYLDSLETKDITLYVNSPGGSTASGGGIISTMDFIGSDVCTINTGMAASYGALILMCGTKGKRKALKLTRTMIHQPLIGNISGQATEIIIEAREMERLRKELYEVIVQQTGQPMEIVEQKCERDCWMTPQEALDFGIIDEIIQKK